MGRSLRPLMAPAGSLKRGIIALLQFTAHTPVAISPLVIVYKSLSSSPLHKWAGSHLRSVVLVPQGLFDRRTPDTLRSGMTFPLPRLPRWSPRA